VKQEAWTKHNFDEELANKGRFEKADMKKQCADYTPTINTQVNTIKNKFPNGNTKNTVKNEPWSTLYGSAALGSQLPLSAHKYLPTHATNPLTR
jgi:hypothetical protein